MDPSRFGKDRPPRPDRGRGAGSRRTARNGTAGALTAKGGTAKTRVNPVPSPRRPTTSATAGCAAQASIGLLPKEYRRMKMIESARLAAAGTTTVGTHEHPDRRRGSYLNRTRGLKHAAKLAPDAGYCEQNIYKD